MFQLVPNPAWSEGTHTPHHKQDTSNKEKIVKQLNTFKRDEVGVRKNQKEKRKTQKVKKN